ncbi:cleavage and polyadenylation specificity factor subunit 6-like [Haliotis cracherodii]|uniref:cleavage and polyadenylation specificity factor subunit 6-like n=1 Tax=Haliotis cracherodii TaxID=6455 RepID=UPI0039E907B5
MPGYAPPMSGYAPPMSGYAPTMPGYAPPMPGHAPPMSGYAPPVSGFPQPQSEMTAAANPVTVVAIQPPSRHTPGPQPPDYKMLSYISCVFCPLLALGAIQASERSRDSYQHGDYGKAFLQGRTARFNAISAIVIGVFGAVVFTVMFKMGVLNI